ncbi:hypothetical protein [Archangium sp.]|uniref:hypothetical protein n=1 Tax=Archangium sp. TaxID=1872627 RepID=UPI00389B2EE1
MSTKSGQAHCPSPPPPRCWSEFFEAPTVAELALNLLQLRSDQVDEGELESMVTQLDQLGEEEIRKQLADPPPGDQ